MGPYDNATGKYLPSPDWENGQWLVHEDGRLYILPLNGDEVEGPDDNLGDQIMRVWIDFIGEEALSERQAEALGLTIVDAALKRFDPSIGYYSA